MSWNTQLDEKLRAIRASCAEHLSLDDLVMLAIETSFLVKKHGCTKILIDLSQARLDFPTDELSRLVELYVEYRLPQATRSGIVMGPEATAGDFSQLLAVAKQRGYVVDVVAKQQADAWLSQLN